MQAEAPPTLTFAASLHLPHGGQGVGLQVGQAAVQVDGGQAALEALAGVDQLGQVAVHLLGDAADVEVAWRRRSHGDGKYSDWSRLGFFLFFFLNEQIKVMS